MLFQRTKYNNKHPNPIGCEAKLACKCLFTPTLFQRAILTRKDQTDLDFGA